MTTALDLISQSFKKAGILGVGQTLLAEDANDALADLQDMLAQWQRKRWLVWHLADVAKLSTGAQSYTVGIGGDFNVVRPDRIEAAFFRQVNLQNAVDYPLEIIQAREDYNRIALKTLTAFPQYVFYDSGFPTGTLYPWPIPQSGLYELHISVKEQLGQITSLSQTLVMPPEYLAAIKWNLAARFRVSYQMAIDEAIVALARESLNVIRGANAQISRLRMPRGLGSGDRYNILGDTTY